MVNVLSIDFDIIMAPDINLYNPLINGTAKIDNLALVSPLLSGVRADLSHYQKIVLYINEIIKYLNVEDIRVSFSHEDIKNVLSSLDDVRVINIDHHHDFGYSEKAEEYCTCANWGKYFKDLSIINSFTWINNVNSELPLDKTIKDFIQTKNLDKTDLLIELPRIDKLFICLSPEWVPQQYHPLFYLMLDLINEKKNCKLQIY